MELASAAVSAAVMAAESGRDRDLGLVPATVVAPVAELIVWVLEFPHPALSMILIPNILKRPVRRSFRGRSCSGLSWARMAGRAISACNGLLAWVSMRKPSKP